MITGSSWRSYIITGSYCGLTVNTQVLEGGYTSSDMITGSSWRSYIITGSYCGLTINTQVLEVTVVTAVSLQEAEVDGVNGTVDHWPFVWCVACAWV